MPESFIQLPPNSTGLKLRSRQRVVGANTVEEQFFVEQAREVVSYRGRAGAFRTLGRAATTRQALLAIHNAAGSAVLVNVNKITVDVTTSVIMAITQVPPVLRVQRLTVLPTGGTALTKATEDTALASSASVTVFGDASADGTNSAVALTTVVVAGVVTQEFAPRIITAVGHETSDRIEFMVGANESVMLRPLEGLVLSVDAITAAAGNPATTSYVATIHWDEYTLP